jgi:hypothetical protein
VTPSQSLQFSEVQEALHCTAALDELMNFIVYITHLAQYEASVQGMANVKAKEGNVIRESLSQWASIFTGQTWIINKKSPPHCDSSGFTAGFDYLTVLGTASSMLTLQDVNITAKYQPGTVVGLPGKALTHEVREWGEGDRICVANWIRKRLLIDHGANDVTWPQVTDITATFGW